MESAIVYLRRSTDVQEASIEDQRKAIDQYVQDNKYKVVCEFVDDAISGKTAENRPGFQGMLDFARKNQQSCTLLVYDVSRFGRFENPKEATYWEVELERNGVKVHYVAEGFSNDGSLGSYITKVVKDAEASEYIKKLSKLTKRGMRSCAERGYWISSPAPYGYQRAIVDPTSGSIERVLAPGERKTREKRVKLVPGNQKEIEVVKDIFDRYVYREQGLRSIADYLNRSSVPNPSGKIRQWHKSTLRNILRNETYIGQISFGKKTGIEFTTEQAHEAIVDADTFRKAQERLKQFAFGKRGGYTTPYLLTALVECDSCHNNLHGATDNGKKRRGYRCGGNLCKGDSVCKSPYYAADRLEKPVLDHIRTKTSSPEWKELVERALGYALGEGEKSLEERISLSQREHVQNKTRIENLLAAISDGLPKETAIKAVQQLERTQETLEDTIQQAETKLSQGTQYKRSADQLYELGTQFDARFDGLSTQEKKRVVKNFLARATIQHQPPIAIYHFYEFPNLIITDTLKPPPTMPMIVKL